METQEKKKLNFVGNGKTYGKKIALSLDRKSIMKIKKSTFKGKDLIFIDVIELNEKDQYGRSHFVIEHEPYKAKKEDDSFPPGF